MRKSKLYIITPLALFLGLISCENDEDALLVPEEESVTQTYAEVLNFTKDKAKYNPGEEVHFSVNGTPSNTTVRYKYLGELIAEEALNSTNWSWTPPAEDFRGYMVELVKTTGTENTVLGTLAVDVSSDWTRFPRYGFLSKFETLSDVEMDRTLDRLKDFHINGLQYYDWHHKHHMPLPLDETGKVAESWQDLFNRDIYLATVENYLSKAKERNIASMFYNLLFGVWNPEAEDGISGQWLLYKDRLHKNADKHELGDLGDIVLADPSNDQWQQYIFDQTETVYENLDFAGWHLDQLGNRGMVYDFTGYEISLPETYQDFLVELNREFPEKKMVLNAVDQFGQEKILQAPVDFAYTEVWSRYQYQDLADVILENHAYSDGQLNTVLAAYLNYDASSGSFNTPSVLMADAVIFAFGGAHLELGEHMLSNEYFPNSKLFMEPELESALVEYYDFMTAYENLLRDGGSFHPIQVSSEQTKINAWPPVYRQVATLGKTFENRQVVHLLNFDGVTTFQWRDDERIQEQPHVKSEFTVHIQSAQPISNVWFASPDINGGASRPLEFTQNGNEITLEVPYLEYWSMLVLEH